MRVSDLSDDRTAEPGINRCAIPKPRKSALLADKPAHRTFVCEACGCGTADETKELEMLAPCSVESPGAAPLVTPRELRFPLIGRVISEHFGATLEHGSARDVC